jgi:hypothetical protein
MPYFPPASTGGSTALSGLTDVVLTSPTNTQVLKYNGTNWVNATDATGGGGGTAPTTYSLTGIPYDSQYAEVIVTDALISSTSMISIDWGSFTDADENTPDMDDVDFYAIPATGSMTVRISVRDQGRLGGTYNIRYTIG